MILPWLPSGEVRTDGEPAIAAFMLSVFAERQRQIGANFLRGKLTVIAAINAKVLEVPVGFKWFVDPLFSGEVAFGGGKIEIFSQRIADGTIA